MSIWESQKHVLCPDLMLFSPEEVGPWKKCEEPGSAVLLGTGKALGSQKRSHRPEVASAALFEHEQTGGRSGRAGTAPARKDRNGPSRVSWSKYLAATVPST